jgi:3-hexulose-6-phosphate synthase
VRLQVAFDDDLDSTLRVLREIFDLVDIAEVGTPLIYREGMHGVRRILAERPDLRVLADLKIMDAGEEEARIAFDAGADMVTVMALAHDATIEGSVRAAREKGCRVVADMMRVGNLSQRGTQLLELGVNALYVHTAFDVQSSQSSPYRQLQELRHAVPDAVLGIAGGVNAERLGDIAPHRPDILVVGGAITRASDPRKAATLMRERIEHHEH